MTQTHDSEALRAQLATNYSNDVNEVAKNAPPKPVSSRAITVDVVCQGSGNGFRCVYVNNFRIVGGKPWVAENLPTSGKKTTIGDVLSAFSQEDIAAYLAEQEATTAYYSGYRAWTEAQKDKQ